jgi:hypothetical protein
MKKAFLVLLSIMAVLSVVLTAEKYYWRYWPFEPIEVCDPLLVMNPGKIVKAGTLLIYKVDFDKKMDVPCTIQRQLVNGYRIDYDAVKPPRKALGKQSALGQVQVPSGTDVGMWKLRWEISCKVGPEDREISYTRETEPFAVVK